ncbi:MAG: helix-turn-helix domain-containing protein [Gammaproteobacteria bacterium]
MYDERAEPMSNTVESAICNLRKKIGLRSAAALLHTRRGMGYVLDEPGA